MLLFSFNILESLINKKIGSKWNKTTYLINHTFAYLTITPDSNLAHNESEWALSGPNSWLLVTILRSFNKRNIARCMYVVTCQKGWNLTILIADFHIVTHYYLINWILKSDIYSQIALLYTLNKTIKYHMANLSRH